MATERSGSKLEEFLHKGGGQHPERQTDKEEKPSLQSALEKELNADDDALAKELQRTRAEEIIARRRASIDRFRISQPGQQGGEVKIHQEGRQWLVDIAMGLLGNGLDPERVGRMIDYLLGVPQAGISLPGTPVTGAGMSFTDMKAIFEMGKESNKTDPAIAVILQKLSEKVEAVERRESHNEPQPKSSIVFIRADGTTQEIEAGKPLVLEREAASGESIEQLKEKNRHAEKMEELQTEKKYKDDLVRVVSDIPESIGRGLASDIKEKPRGRQQAAQTGELQKVDCEVCHATIHYPNDATNITCPKCGAIYTREPKTQTESRKEEPK